MGEVPPLSHNQEMPFTPSDRMILQPAVRPLYRMDQVVSTAGQWRRQIRPSKDRPCCSSFCSFAHFSRVISRGCLMRFIC
ncbi:hypothetical protein ACN38_g125 [Penicillium nordicum]|uniref:Uncharacterized protein n=1 Tax=Penicillium nordicum TaxID=229535 RepID=A0A0M8PBA0_9EURO|nr:hypothetical protein ACN38_g125 [Penicillium nordicum]